MILSHFCKILMIAVGSGGGNLINVPQFDLCFIYDFYSFDFVCLFACFVVVFTKSSL